MKRTLLQFGIPIFFYISGQACSFNQLETKGFCNFLLSNVVRLMLPFLVGLIVFLVPMHYLLQDIDKASKLPDGCVENNFGKFVVKLLPIIIEKMSWLWFLLALFLSSINSYGFQRWV